MSMDAMLDDMLDVAVAGAATAGGASVAGRGLSVGAAALPLPLLLLWMAVPWLLARRGVGRGGDAQTVAGMTVVGPIMLSGWCVSTGCESG